MDHEEGNALGVGVQKARKLFARIGVAHDHLRQPAHFIGTKPLQRYLQRSWVLRDAAAPLGGVSRVVGAEGEHNEDAFPIHRRQQGIEHRPTGRVGPLHVFEDQDEQLIARRAPYRAHNLFLQQ